MTPEERLQVDYGLIAGSGLFDAAWYLSQLPDGEEQAGADALLHYLKHSAGTEPSPFFDTAWYLQTNQDVAGSGRNPFAHFVEWGWRENRDPSPKFSLATYLRAHPDLLESGYNPLLHAVVRGEVVRPGAHLAPAAGPASSAAAWETGLAPLISIILPIYNTPVRFFREVIQSVLNQNYPHWELCIVDDASTSAATLAEMDRVQNLDRRIWVRRRRENGGIAVASQEALEMCEGEFVAFVDHDDMLKADVLASVVEMMRQDPLLDYIFTDHVTIDEQGARLSSSRKPGWAPEFFLATNYIVHFKVMRRSLVLKVGGFSQESSVVQDIGLSCRMVEAGARIGHLPKEGYFWRAHSTSVASGTSGKPAIETLALATYAGHLERRGIPAKIVWPEDFRVRRLGAYKLDFTGLDVPVSIAILDPEGVADLAELRRELASVEWGADIELVVVQGGDPGADPDGGAVRRRPRGDDLLPLLMTLRYEHVVFLAPRCVMITSDWLRELVGYLGVDSEIGAVGGKILDHRLRVIDGGLVYRDTIKILGAGESDVADGHWFTNRLASNVEAVSAGLMATTKRALSAAGAWRFGDPVESGSAFCLNLREGGQRVVFNPWARMVQARSLHPPKLRSPSTDAYHPA